MSIRTISSIIFPTSNLQLEDNHLHNRPNATIDPKYFKDLLEEEEVTLGWQA